MYTVPSLLAYINVSHGIFVTSFGDVGDVDDDVTESFSVVECPLGESDLSVSHFISSPFGPVNLGRLFSFFHFIRL